MYTYTTFMLYDEPITGSRGNILSIKHVRTHPIFILVFIFLEAVM